MSDRIRVELAALVTLRDELTRQIESLPDAAAVRVGQPYGAWAEARWLQARNVAARARVVELRAEVEQALEALRHAVHTARETYATVDSDAAHRARAQAELSTELAGRGAA